MSGETEQWQPWLARHGPALVLFARQWTNSLVDAEDAVQNGFVRFWQSRGTVRGIGYLYACVRTAAIDLHRAGRARPNGTGVVRLEIAFESPFAPEQAELAATVEAALAQLPTEQREVVVMKIWGDLTFLQIAEALQISPNTAASRYRYALARLETALADEVNRE